MKKILISFLLLAVLLVACSKQRSVNMEEKTYEELCKSNGDVWMEMEETRDGEMMSDEMCFGCMIEENHFCNSENYVRHVNLLQYGIK